MKENEGTVATAWPGQTSKPGGRDLDSIPRTRPAELSEGGKRHTDTHLLESVPRSDDREGRSDDDGDRVRHRCGCVMESVRVRCSVQSFKCTGGKGQ
jgi:hypothetical protein